MKILLLGGTGAMGVHLAQILADKGNEVHITSRRKFAEYKSDFAKQKRDFADKTKKSDFTQNTNHANHANIHYICGNAQDLDFTLDLLDLHKYDCVVDFMIYATIEFLDRVELLLGKCVHYVFLSSARVYASSDEPLREDSPRLLDISKDKEYLATDEYALAKARQENILAHSHKRNYTIIRPYITFSEIRLQLGVYEKESWLYRALQGKSIVFFKDIATHYTTMTYAQEVARAIAVICGNPSAYRQTYHIASEKAVKWEEILAIYQKVLKNELGREVKVVFANLGEFFGKNAYQVIYDRLFDRKFDSSKINALLTQNGEKQLGGGSLETHIALCLKEFIQNPCFNGIDFDDEIKKDALCREMTELRQIQGIQNKLTYLKAYKRNAKGFLAKIKARILYRGYKWCLILNKLRGKG